MFKKIRQFINRDISFRTMIPVIILIIFQVLLVYGPFTHYLIRTFDISRKVLERFEYITVPISVLLFCLYLIQIINKKWLRKDLFSLGYIGVLILGSLFSNIFFVKVDGVYNYSWNAGFAFFVHFYLLNLFFLSLLFIINLVRNKFNIVKNLKKIVDINMIFLVLNICVYFILTFFYDLGFKSNFYIYNIFISFIYIPCFLGINIFLIVVLLKEKIWKKISFKKILIIILFFLIISSIIYMYLTNRYLLFLLTFVPVGLFTSIIQEINGIHYRDVLKLSFNSLLLVIAPIIFGVTVSCYVYTKNKLKLLE
jgi:hypothetical protein